MQAVFVIVLGALMFGALGVAATTYVAPKFERKLGAEVERRLEEAGLPGDGVFIAGRDVWVDGALTNDDSFERVRTVLAGVDGMRELRRRTPLAERVARAQPASLDIAWTETDMSVVGTLGAGIDPTVLDSALMAQFPDLTLSTDVATDPDVTTAHWEARLPAILEAARDAMPEGGVSLRGSALVVRGTVSDENLRTETGERIATALPGVRVVNRIRLPSAAGPVAELLDELFEGELISFEARSDNLTAQSISLLERAAVILEDHPDVTVRIEGYDDVAGNPVHSGQVSLVRAQLVRDFLIRRGARPGSLVIRGMGRADSPADTGSLATAEPTKVRLVVETE